MIFRTIALLNMFTALIIGILIDLPIRAMFTINAEWHIVIVLFVAYLFQSFMSYKMSLWMAAMEIEAQSLGFDMEKFISKHTF